MMTEYLVVDGYNVMYAWSELDKIKESSMEHARDKLIDMLVNYAALSGEKVVIVFDAHRVKSRLERTEVLPGVQVIYTNEGETADSVIERLAGEYAARGIVYVVTSDWDEQRVTFGRGAYRMTPGELRGKIKQVSTEGQKPYAGGRPADSYLEHRLERQLREILEHWRRKKR